jgi:hypothetical protein
MIESRRKNAGNIRVVRPRALTGVLFNLLLLLCTAGPAAAQTPASAKPLTPVLIELFTSEGCSSCPPADALLSRIDASQPIPGAQAIVLSEHVDYWNHDGWADPFSSSFFTDRQESYVRAMQGSSPYTPQMIVNGNSEVRLSQTDQLKQSLLDAARAQRLPVTISALTIDSGTPATLRAHVDIDGGSSSRSADVFAVLALNHAESQVLRGENGGRRLSHTAVALDFVRIGKLEKGKPFSQDYQTRLNPGVDPKNLRLIVFVQEPGPGEVLGAALQEVGHVNR